MQSAAPVKNSADSDNSLFQLPVHVLSQSHWPLPTTHNENLQLFTVLQMYHVLLLANTWLAR